MLQHERKQRGLDQGIVAAQLGLSQSAYSRLESGDSNMSLAQLYSVAQALNTSPSAILYQADQAAHMLSQQGVQMVAEKPDNKAAVLVGLGLLLALLAARS